MTEPVRITDPDVSILMRYGKDSPEGKAALKRLVQQLAEWVDNEALKAVYRDVYRRG